MIRRRLSRVTRIAGRPCYEPGIVQPYESAGWFPERQIAPTSHSEQTSAAPNENYTWPDSPLRPRHDDLRHRGSHSIRRRAAELGIGYDAKRRPGSSIKTACPFSVIVMNTPVRYWANLNADLGVFAHGLVTRKRMTINLRRAAGVLRGSQCPLESNHRRGRFAQNGTFGPQDMPTSTTIAPR